MKWWVGTYGRAVPMSSCVVSSRQCWQRCLDSLHSCMQSYLASLMDDMGRLLGLVIASVASERNVQSVEGEIQNAIADSSIRGETQLTEQLKLVKKAVSTMARTNVSPKEVQYAVTSSLRNSLQLDADALLMAVNCNQATQQKLALNVPGLEARVKALHETVNAFVEVTQKDQIAISSEVEDVKRVILQHVTDPHERAIINANWVAQVCSHVPKAW